jgi:Flp pilus assembly protein TadG
VRAGGAGSRPAGRTSRANPEQGQSLVEFTLVLVPLLLILFGIIEFGIVMFNKTTDVHAAREAVRYAAVNQTLPATVTADMPSGAKVTFKCTTDPNSGNAQGQYNVGDEITATVSYSQPIDIPLISNIVGTSINLSSNATLPLETAPTKYC